jgi:murein DD-endopeptidase MepM/ murein hydrolase activator NlpD
LRRSLSSIAAILAVWAPLTAAADGGPDTDIRPLFQTWRQAPSAGAPSRTQGRFHGMARPALGIANVTSAMGMRRNPVLGRTMFHAGVDLAALRGTAVHATAPGRVIRAGWAGGYGLLITISHQGGYETRYAHMERLSVSPGALVHRGQLIGFVGSTGRSTGPHLHYEVRHDGQVMDPQGFLRRR